MNGVVINGDGVAACCCAHLLKRAGLRVAVKRADRPRLPVIMLSDAAVALMLGVFEDLSLDHLPRIRKRVVAWGRGSEPVTLDHAASIVSEQELLERLWSGLALDEEAEPDWTIFSSRPLPPGAVERTFGSRMASVTSVTLKGACDTCWIESLENGWLFLIPSGPGKAFLLSVGSARLSDSRIVGEQIHEVGEAAMQFPAYPRVLSTLCGAGWLACGTAAMAFDPLCGDGTSHAVREAILAAAVIQAAANGENPKEVLSHYEARMLAGFGRHLALCSQFYKTGHDTQWWKSELRSLNEGMAWCGEQLSNRRSFQYQLNGFELQPSR